MLIPRTDRKTHWYLPDGAPFHDVQKADGSGLRPATIRDAEKAGAYRSVTNVLSVLAKKGLVYWQNEQAVLSALTLPRRHGETEHDFAKRVIVDSEEQVMDAARAGSLIHEAASNFLVKHIPPQASDVPASSYKLNALLAPFMAWVHQNIKRTIYSEAAVVNPNYHYAGTLDIYAELKDGRLALIDLKSQEVERTAKGQLKGSFHEDWAMQLAAYANCLPERVAPIKISLISIIIGRNEPACLLKEWEDGGHHFAAFTYACGLWSYIKGCTPGSKAV